MYASLVKASLVAVLLMGMVACASGPERRPSTIAPPPPAPTVITNATYGDALRRFQAMPLSDASRVTLRDRLVEHLIAKGHDESAVDRYQALIAHLYAVTSLYTSVESSRTCYRQGRWHGARAVRARLAARR